MIRGDGPVLVVLVPAPSPTPPRERLPLRFTIAGPIVTR